MGSTLCKSISIHTSNDLKHSRFDPSVRNDAKPARAKVEPYNAKLSTMNTSFLNHTKSNIHQGSTRQGDFLEELDCTHCQGVNYTKTEINSLNGDVSVSSVIDNKSLDKLERPSRPPTPVSSCASVMVDAQIEPTDGTRLFQDEVFVSDARPPHIRLNSINKSIQSFDDNSERDLTFRSLSTIPLVDMDEDEPIFKLTSSHRSQSNSLDRSIDLNIKSSNAETSTTRRHSSLESLANFGDESSSVVFNDHSLCNVQKNKKHCSFCDFVKNGQGGQRWSELDKDFSVLMETVEKLGTILSEKEMALKEVKNHNGNFDSHHNESSYDSVADDEIVEEKKVSFSFLEKIKGNDLKEKVHELRQKKRIGISFLKTVRGNKLMVFSDGHNTYHIQGDRRRRKRAKNA